MPLPTFYNLPEAKRQVLLDCAIDEFARHDYDSASISKIVSRAGIAKGSLYQYFLDKQDLHKYLLELAAQKKAEIISTFSPPEQGLTMFDTLRHLFKVIITFEIQYPKLARIGYRAINGNAPMPEEVLLKAKQSTQQYFYDLIEEGKRRSEIRPEVDSGMAAYIFSSSLSGMSEYLRSHHLYDFAGGDIDSPPPINTFEIEDTFEQIISIFENGIAMNEIEKGKNK